MEATSSRRCPVSARILTIGPKGHPRSLQASQTALSSSSDRTRSRLRSADGALTFSHGEASRSPRSTAQAHIPHRGEASVRHDRRAAIDDLIKQGVHVGARDRRQAPPLPRAHDFLVQDALRLAGCPRFLVRLGIAFDKGLDDFLDKVAIIRRALGGFCGLLRRRRVCPAETLFSAVPASPRAALRSMPG